MSASHVNTENPWPGLAPYTTEDSAWFRGRNRELEDLVRRIEQNSLTVLFSRSGIGKSSLLRAALIPRLRRDAYLPIYVRLDFSSDGSSLVDQVWTLLDRHVGLPERYLAGADGSRPSLWEFFHDQNEGILGPRLSGIVPVLIFDQFEEIFTLGESSDFLKRSVAHLIEELADLAEGRPPAWLQERFNEGLGEIERFDFDERPGHLLIALREDFLSHLERHRKRLPMVMENRMPLNPLNGLQALDAVVGPAPHLLDEEVAEQIVRFVGGDTEAPMANLTIDPSLLNLICRELNNLRRKRGQSKLTAELLGKSREAILEGFYDGCFDQLDDSAANFVERELLTRSGHRESLSEERAIENIGNNAVAHLVNRRLLSVEERGGVRRVELSHDLLSEVAARRREERLSREEEEQKEAERLAYRLQVEEAKRKQARMLRFAAFMGVVCMGASLAAFHAWKKEREAQEARLRADQLARENAAQSSEADFLLASEYHRTGKTSLAIAHLARSLRSNPGNIAAADSAIGLLLNPSTDVGWLPEFRALEHRDSIRQITWNPNPAAPPGQPALLVVAGGTVSLWKMPATKGEEPSLAHELVHRYPDGHSIVVRGAAWSPDGGTVATWAADMVIRVWDSGTGKLRRELAGHTDTVNQVAFHPSGKIIASASYDHSVRLWDSIAGTPRKTLATHSLCVNHIGFSRDGRTLASASDDGTVRLWDLLTETESGILSHDGSAVNHVEFGNSTDHPRLLTIGETGLRWWNWTTGNETTDSPRFDPSVVATFSPDGRQFVVATSNGTHIGPIPSLGAGLSGWPFEEQNSPEGIAYSPEGRRLARWSRETLRIWGAETHEPFGKPLRVSVPIRAAAWSSDTRRLAVASGIFVTIWDASEHAPLVVSVPNHQGESTSASPAAAASASASLLSGGALVGTIVNDVARLWSSHSGAPAGREIRPEKISDIAAFSPDGTIFVGCIKNEVTRYSTRSGKPLGSPGTHDDEIQGIAFHRDGSRFATASTDHTVKVWDSRTGELLQSIRHPLGKEIASARFSPDGSLLLFIGYNSTAYLADAATGRVHEDHPFAHADRINSAEFSPCGRFVVTASNDRFASIWRVDTGEKVRSILHLDSVYRARFSSDGQMIATLIRDDRKIDLWSVNSGRKVGKSLLHEDSIKAFSFSAGPRVITASLDGTAQVWDTNTGEPIGGRLVHASGVTGVEFSIDGKSALTTSTDGKARVWETFSSGSGTSGETTPEWLPRLLDEATDILIKGTSQESRNPPSSSQLRETLTKLSLPWSMPFLEQNDHYERAAAWLSLAPDKRPGAFDSKMPAEEEKEILLSSTNPADIRRAFQLGPHEGTIQAALARIEDDRERSDFLIDFALDRSPGDPETIFQAAQALELRSSTGDAGAEDLRRATELLSEAVASHPGNAHCLRALGWLKSRAGEKEASIGLFERAITSDPDDPDIREYYGFALSLLGEADRALVQWGEAERLSPPGTNLSDIFAGVCIGQWKLGRRDEAVATFRKLADSDPDRDWSLPGTIDALTGDWTPEERALLSEIRARFLETP